MKPRRPNFIPRKSRAELFGPDMTNANETVIDSTDEGQAQHSGMSAPSVKPSFGVSN